MPSNEVDEALAAPIPQIGEGLLRPVVVPRRGDCARQRTRAEARADQSRCQLLTRRYRLVVDHPPNLRGNCGRMFSDATV